MADDDQGPFAGRIKDHPLFDDAALADVAAFRNELTAASQHADLVRILEEPLAERLLAGTFAGSPYLTSLIRRDPMRLHRILTEPPERRARELFTGLAETLERASNLAEAQTALRRMKQEIALLTALSDLAGIWPVMTVTRVLSDAGDQALRHAVRYLFREAATRGDWLGPDPKTPDATSGYFVLAVGKYGAFELNYSSDIDLIVFYERTLVKLRDGVEPATFFVRLTRDLVRLIEERTPDGYVFRTDLRLRPDAGATQIALSTDAAAGYYESFGQNWERAALIKARPVAGDLDAGEAFLADLQPFIWRRHLDYAAIADIHAMKRQINAFRGFTSIGVAGQNIKLGPGGIREVEFFVQTQQLIGGGRQRHLRVRATLDALRALTAHGWIDASVAEDLAAAYLALRRIEHRLQMTADEQTHEVPEDEMALLRLARFSGFATIEAFSEALLDIQTRVRAHYARLFETSPDLATSGTNLVFAGENDDPQTLETLAELGFSRPSDVLAEIRGWHHGRYPAVRSARARELLTEVQPLLVRAFAETADPDRAMASFDRFLAELPAGVQLFSLLRANPALLRLLADIMGTAPRLARALSRRRRLLDAVIDRRTMGALPSESELAALIHADLDGASDLEEVLNRARIAGSEQAFLIGVKILSGIANASQAGLAYARLAERLIAELLAAVERDLEASHGRVQGGRAVVVAMGKLGGREMTASSDLDLIVVYDFAPECTQSDGAKPLAPTAYYARLTQRLINALSAPTSEGTLYEVDMRLRPSGQKGPVAAQFATFREYQASEAWTWEHLALTRARVVAGDAALGAEVEGAIRDTLCRSRDRDKIAADVRAMRTLIATEKGTDDIWNLKQVRGGLVDLEFIAQYLELIHAHAHPMILDQTTVAAYQRLNAHGLLAPDRTETLVQAARLLHDLTQVLRLCFDDAFDPETAPKGLKQLLARAGNMPDFQTLEAHLRATLGDVHKLFDSLVA